MAKEMKVIMFQPRFSAKVLNGTKCTTIRPTRKNPIAPGDALSLREWTGKPYRSKQRILRETFCSRLYRIEISGHGISLDGVAMCHDGIAKGDGFTDFYDLLQWFISTHGLPFQGVLIEWPKK